MGPMLIDLYLCTDPQTLNIGQKKTPLVTIKPTTTLRTIKPTTTEAFTVKPSTSVWITTGFVSLLGTGISDKTQDYFNSTDPERVCPKSREVMKAAIAENLL